MARTPVVANGIDLDSEAPVGGDSALVGDPSGDGHVVIDGDEEDENWDKPGGSTEKKRPAARQDNQDVDADFDEEDARLAYSDSDEPGERSNSKRAQRNARRRERKLAADSQIAELRGALEEQARVIKSLVTGQGSLAVNTVAGQISQLESSLRITDEEMAAAVKNSDGDTYAKAQSIRDRIVSQMAILRSQKERMDAAVGGQVEDDGRQQPPQRQQQQVDPRVVQAVESHFDRFCERFPWFDPESDEPDCNIVRAVDAHLVRQGYQRHTPAFWQQMERTMATRYKLMPDRGEGEGDDAVDDLPPPRRQPQQRENGMANGGRPPTSNGRGAANGRGGFHLSEHQTSMLRDEGLLGEGLSKEDIAKRDRIMNKWKAGADSLRRTGAR